MIISDCIIAVNSIGEELVQHGTARFPIACYEEDIAKYPVSWHWHEDFELILICSGSAIVSVATEEYVIHENEGIFINSGTLHSVQPKEHCECMLKSLVFHPRLIGSVDSIFWQKYLEPILHNKALPYLLLTPSNEIMADLLDQSLAAWNYYALAKQGYEIFLRNELSKVMFSIYSNYFTNDVTPTTRLMRNANRIKEMLQYIHTHFSESITLCDLANQVSLSESEVLRCFRSMIHTTPTQYLKQYRIQRACALLTSTDLSTSEIAFECGFQSSSYFIKTFREKMKQTPLAYRKAIKY